AAADAESHRLVGGNRKGDRNGAEIGDAHGGTFDKKNQRNTSGLTTLAGRSPRSSASIVSTAPRLMPSMLVAVTPATCGVSRRCGAANHGSAARTRWRGGG